MLRVLGNDCLLHPGLQDGNVRVYSILGTTLKDEGKLLEATGPVTDLAYSHDGAFLAVCDASKVVTVFSVADGYSVSGPWTLLSLCTAQVQVAGGSRTILPEPVSLFP
jgi:WD40 repeat protein